MESELELSNTKTLFPRDVAPAAEEFFDDEDEEVASQVKEITNHPVVRRQNNCFLLALVLCVIAFAVYTVSNVYFSDDALREEYGSHGGASNGGGIPAQGGNIGTKDVGNAAGNMQHTKGKGKDYLRKKKEIEQWHNTTVTIKDGVRYKVLEKLIHDKNAFTEGLTFVNGRLFESVGLYQQSNLRELDPETGEVIDSWPMDHKYFAEGLTYVDGHLLQLTYKKNTGFIYDFENLSAPPSQFQYQTITHEGWGMTYDAKKKEIIVSDGSDFLLFWDPETLQETRRLKVQRQFNKNSRQINELEVWRDRVLANVWYEDTIIVINPATGIVEKEYDFRQLYPADQRRHDRADVLNGIAVSADPDILYVTGKKWDRMFKIKLL